MKKTIRFLCLILTLAILSPGMAMAAGLTAGDGVYGVYRGEGTSVYQTWFSAPLAT